MDGRISFTDSGPGKTRIVIECSGGPEEVERANLYVTPRLGDAAESMTQWTSRHALFVEVQDTDALAALQAAVAVLDTLRTNGLLNLTDIAT